MKQRLLIIGPEERDKLQRLKEFAETNPLSMQDLQATIAGTKPPVGDDVRFVVYVPNGYRVVYSIEEQKPGKYRHCSISVSEKGKFPNPIAFNELIKLLGFKYQLLESNLSENMPYIHLEPNAINILEKM